MIEGDVENCVLFRGVKIAKGAKIRNSVLMQDTVVNAGARLDYVVTDKNVTIEVCQELKGTDTQPFYVAKGILFKDRSKPVNSGEVLTHIRYV